MANELIATSENLYSPSLTNFKNAPEK